MSLLTAVFLCFKDVILKSLEIPSIPIIRLILCKKLTSHVYYFFSCWQINKSGRKKYLLFNELSVTRAQIGDFSLFKNILKYFSLVKIRQLNLKEKSLKLSMNHGAY